MTNNHNLEVADLQQRITELEQRLNNERAHYHIFEALAENAPDVVTVGALDGTLTYVNPTYKDLSGYGDDLLGMNIVDLHAEGAPGVEPVVTQVFAHGYWQGIWQFRHKDGHSFPTELSGFLIKNEAGQPVALGAIIRDVAEQERLRVEQEQRKHQAQIIEAQRAALRELSTPLIPIADKVVIMPLIGTIDTNRAQQVMETLLNGVATYHAEKVLLDITGVKTVDSQVADTFIRAAQAVRLLGAEVVMTGISPAMAQTLIGLGIDLSGIVTHGTLQTGIASVLRRA